MGWREVVDEYCERAGSGYWAEPLNALTNLAFLIAAVVMWRRVGGRPTGRMLSVLLAVIGIGSWLFHTHATRWASVADVVPIVVFILAYLFVANRDFLGLRPGLAALAAAAFLPYAVATGAIFARIAALGSSAAYGPVPVLILVYAAIVRRRAPATARGLAAGAGLLVLSLTFRTLDLPLCESVPSGTHFLWHLMNGLMLGWMIEVWRRHVAGLRQAGGPGREG